MINPDRFLLHTTELEMDMNISGRCNEEGRHLTGVTGKNVLVKENYTVRYEFTTLRTPYKF